MDHLVRDWGRLSSPEPFRQRPSQQVQFEEPIDNNVNSRNKFASGGGDDDDDGNSNLIDSSPQDKLSAEDGEIKTNSLASDPQVQPMAAEVNNVERLTVLEEPTGVMESRSGLSGSSRSNNNTINRETNLLISASPVSQPALDTQTNPIIQHPSVRHEANSDPSVYNADVRGDSQRNMTSPDGNSHSTTFLGFSSILILLLGMIILYNWLMHRKKGNGRQKWTIVDFWPASLLPSEYILSRSNKKFPDNRRQTLSRRTSKSGELDRMTTLDSSGEHVQLVDRRPLGSCKSTRDLPRDSDIAEEPEEEDCEAIEVIQRIEDQPTIQESQGPLSMLNDKFVILKRRLAESSLIVAVESSGKPKVRLLRAKLRKFIDEEADELRWKRENEKRSQIWYQKALYHIFDWLRSESKPTSAKECEQMMQNESKQVEDQPTSVQVQVNSGNEKTDSELQPKARLECALGLTSNKLSPSPIVPDGCSSLSGCSLLSPSPTVEQHQAPVCHCTLSARPKWDSGFNQVLPAMRSRSQGHSPCQLGASSQLNDPYRPCCSTSPSAYKHQPHRQVTVCNQMIQHQQQPMIVPTRHQQMMQHRYDLMARKPSFERPTTTTCDELLAARGHYATLAKCGAHNHIKRQYENYYDEERGDAYHRLTASYGMGVGLEAQGSGSRDPAGADASLLSLDYPTCNTGQPPFTHCDNLPTGHLAGPQCDRIRSIGTSQAHLPPNTSGEIPCKCCNRAEPMQGLYGQQQVVGPAPFEPQCQFKWAGSMSEPQSSASTSLGGSDSGFVVSNAGSNVIYQPGGVCRDPSCACQPQPTCPPPVMPAPPMSILVQQPSMATPPPPVARESPSGGSARDDITKTGKPAETVEAERTEKPAKRCPPPLGSLAVRKSCSATGRPRWKHRRRLSQRRRADLTPPCRPATDTQQPEGSRFAGYPSRGPPPARRMSIAGDQVYPARAMIARESLLAGGPAQSAALMQHRASIAGSEGPWSQSAGWYSGRGGPRSQQQPSNHASSPAHPPSDASFYEGYLLPGSQCCSASSSTASVLNGTQLAMTGGRIAACSAYSSSSGGSSSGIGITGSACTNTPTSTHLPYGGSFASGREAMPDNPSMCPSGYHRHLYGSRHHYHQHPSHYPHTTAHHGAQLTGDSVCQASTCPSRKYSLPVQLEASATTCSSGVLERLSPNQHLQSQTQRPNRFLFEKNLQRVDSVGAPIGEMPASAPLRHQQMSMGDSRRSSQTVTRQSSFWLEDNSVDMSVVSSLTTSGLGDAGASDEDIATECPPNLDRPPGSSRRPSESQQVTTSQRPSISSLIQSADSIESVKHRPPAEQRAEPPGEAGKQPVVAQESSSSLSSSFENRPETQSSSSPASKEQPPAKGPVGRCSRLSSTSTSTSTSSPSPDFSRPSERILALAPNSSSISKRHLFGRLRSRSTRYPRLGGTGSYQHRRPPALSAIAHQHSAPSSSSANAAAAAQGGALDDAEEAAKSDGCPTTPLLGSSSVLKDSESNDEVIRDFKSNVPSERTISDLNSTSLERQCRELWKLRATLHEDACAGQDDWSNYHQRLNRRYDSGYKSIENQLSSSLENNHLSASMNLAAAAAAAAAAARGLPRDPSTPARPPSGCSAARPQSCEPERGRTCRRPTSADAIARIKLELASTGQPFSLDLDSEPAELAQLSGSGKLAELDTHLDSASNGDLVLLGANSNEALDRESCQSRSSNGEPESSNHDLGSPPPQA